MLLTNGVVTIELGGAPGVDEDDDCCWIGVDVDDDDDVDPNFAAVEPCLVPLPF